MPLTLPSRSLIDALAQRGILGPKQDQIRRDAGLANPRATSMDSAHETVPFDKPIVGFGPSIAMSPAPEQSAPRPSIMDAVQSLRASVGSSPAPYVHRGLDLGMIPQDRLAAGAGNLEGPLFEPPVLPRNYSPAELPEYRRLREPTVIHDPSPIEAALGRRLTASERAPLPMPAPSDRPGSMMRGEFMDVSPRASRGPVTDPFDIEELVSSPEFEEVGVMDFGGSGPSRLFSRNLPERTLDDDIRDALDELGRTGTPQERLGVMLKMKEIEDGKSRGSGLTFEERKALQDDKEKGLITRAELAAELRKRSLDVMEDKLDWQRLAADARGNKEKTELLLRALDSEEKTAKFWIENSTDPQQRARSENKIREIQGIRSTLTSQLVPGADGQNGATKTGANAAPKKPTEADWTRVRDEVMDANPGVTDEDALIDLMIDAMESQGFNLEE